MCNLFLSDVKNTFQFLNVFFFFLVNYFIFFLKKINSLINLKLRKFINIKLKIFQKEANSFTSPSSKRQNLKKKKMKFKNSNSDQNLVFNSDKNT